LAEAGHDVDWVGELPEDPGDDAILALAWREQRVLITLDKDFGMLAVIMGRPHAGIIRLVDTPALEQGPASIHILDRYGEELARGALITVEPHRVRIRPRD
jgi:predicted nuclease of predicted toxin-antitoxin system